MRRRGRRGERRRGTLGISAGDTVVVARVVPVGAPFVHVLAHVEQAVAVRLGLPTGSGPFVQRVGVIAAARDGVVAPWVEFLLEASAGGELPFGFGGQADGDRPSQRRATRSTRRRRTSSPR